MRTFLLCTAFTLMVAACGGSSSDSGAPATGDDMNVTGTTWQKMLSCEGDKVVVDVDTGERRHLQVVVRDPAAFAVLDATITYSEIKNPTERIYRGDSPFGVFSSGDLRHFRTYDVAGGPGGRPGIDALVKNGDLHLRQLDLSKPGCEPYSLHTSPPDDAYPDACEAANYVFHGCTAQ